MTAKGSGGKGKVPVRRTPRERFEKYAPPRTESVLDALSLLAKCGNKLTYEFTQADVDKIFDAIRATVDQAQAVFESEGSSRNKFSL